MRRRRTSLGKGPAFVFVRRAASAAYSSVDNRSGFGFTLLEMMIVVSITGILMTLSTWGFFSLKNKVSQRNFVADINSALSSGKMRAMSRQRNVVFVFDTSGGGAYYELDDTSVAQNLNTQVNLTTVRTTFSATAPNYGLPPLFSVSLISTGNSSGTIFIANTASWGRDTMSMPVPFPYPYSGIAVDTSGGCTFCATGRGVLAFRPDGKVVFGTTVGVPVGGALVLGQGQSNSQMNLRALFVSLSGHVGSATQ